MQEENRTLPQAVELEEAVLGALLLEMLNERCINVTQTILAPEMFYKDSHKIIFATIQKMFVEGKPIDICTITEYLSRDGKIKEVGGAYYISQLTNRVASSANVEFHARIILQKWVQREIITSTAHVQNRCYNHDEDIFGLFDQLRETITIEKQITVGQKEAPLLAELTNEERQDSDERAVAAKENKVYGVKTGFWELDRTTNGFQRAQLIILAARPGMGKTSLALGIGRNAAGFGIPVLVFSMEMRSVELVSRMITVEASIDNEIYKSGKMTPEQMQQADGARSTLNQLPMRIDDTPALSINEIKSAARRWWEKSKGGAETNPYGLIIIDYLQLATGSKLDRKNNNREQEISAISGGLKALAKELDIPVLALSQLNRAVETRGGDKRPQLSDLRDSGAIEQDADMVLFIHRPEYYGMSQTAEGDSTAGLAELIIAKHRGGKLGNIDLKFDGQYTRFSNWTDNWYNPSAGITRNENFTESF